MASAAPETVFSGEAAVGRLGPRLVWGMADQALTSLGTFGVGLIVIRTVSLADVGAFAVGLATFVFSLSFARAVANEPFAAGRGRSSESHWRADVSAAAGVALVIGTLVGALLVVTGRLTDGPLSAALTAFGIFLPALILHDSFRYALVGGGKGQAAFRADLVWVAVSFAIMAGLLAADRATLSTLIAAWGLGSLVATAALARSLQLRPRVRAGMSWLRRNHRTSSSFAAEAVALVGGWQLALFGIGATAGLEALGALRSAEMLVGPLNIALTGVGIVALPEAARIARAHPEGLTKAVATLSVVLVVLAAAWGGLVLAMPARLGQAVLGDAWTEARSLLPALVVVTVAGASQVGALAGLRAVGRLRRGLQVRVLLAATMVVGGVGGALAAGAAGGAAGLAAASVLGTTYYWYAYATEHRGAALSPRVVD